MVGRGWAGVVIRVRGGRPGRSHGSTRGHRSSDTACCPLRGAENHKTKKTLIPFLTLVSCPRIARVKGLRNICQNNFLAGNVRPWWAAAPVPPVPAAAAAVAQQPPSKQRSPAAPEGNRASLVPRRLEGVITGEEDHEPLLPLRSPT